MKYDSRLCARLTSTSDDLCVCVCVCVVFQYVAAIVQDKYKTKARNLEEFVMTKYVVRWER